MSPQKYWNHTGVPVMAMDDIRHPVKTGNHIKYGFAEEPEAFRFIQEIGARRKG